MSANEDTNRAPKPATQRRMKPGEAAAGGNVGNALRSVYDETVGEAIPSEMLDLLGKLA